MEYLLLNAFEQNYYNHIKQFERVANAAAAATAAAQNTLAVRNHSAHMASNNNNNACTSSTTSSNANSPSASSSTASSLSSSPASAVGSNVAAALPAASPTVSTRSNNNHYPTQASLANGKDTSTATTNGHKLTQKHAQLTPSTALQSQPPSSRQMPQFTAAQAAAAMAAQYHLQHLQHEQQQHLAQQQQQFALNRAGAQHAKATTTTTLASPSSSGAPTHMHLPHVSALPLTLPPPASHLQHLQQQHHHQHHLQAEQAHAHAQLWHARDQQNNSNVANSLFWQPWRELHHHLYQQQQQQLQKGRNQAEISKISSFRLRIYRVCKLRSERNESFQHIFSK